MAAELNPRTPEEVAVKQPTILKQITDILTPRTEGKNADLFIAGVVNHSDHWPEVYMSPRQPTFDPDALNTFRDRLLDSLRAGIEGHDLMLNKIKNAKKLPRVRSDEEYGGLSFRGGVALPSIEYKSEHIGKKVAVTTTHLDVSDTLLHEKEEKGEQFIRRGSTEILIYPSSEVAELALAARQERDRLPKGFDHRIRHTISRRQIEDLAKTTLKPSSSNGQ